MSLKQMRAALSAISVHTEVKAIDDENQPVHLGLWHLLYSASALAEVNGTSLDRIAQGIRASREANPPLYLVKVTDAVGPATVALPDAVREYEVRAADLGEAVAFAADPAGPGKGRISIRSTLAPYSGEYVAPDHSRYAGFASITSDVAEGDLHQGPRNAVRSRFAPFLTVVGLGGIDRVSDDVEAARLALAAFSAESWIDVAEKDCLEAMVGGLWDLSEQYGEPFAAVVKDVASAREDLIGRHAETKGADPRGFGRF